MKLKEIYSPISKDLSNVEDEIRKQIRYLVSAHGNLDAIFDSFFNSFGQKLRPSLVILSAKSIINDCEDFEESVQYKKMIILCAIVELIHCATLIHDDVIDESCSRRNKRSLNSLFGNKIAILAGDMLYSHAFLLLTEHFEKNIISILSKCVQRMCRGEINQLLDFNFDEYIGIIEDKTAIFMSACCQASAVLVSKDTSDSSCVKAFKDFGLNFGMIYQLVDDFKDQDENVSFVNSEKTLNYFNQCITKTEDCFKNMPKSVYTEKLIDLTTYVIEQNKVVKDSFLNQD